MFLDHRRRGGEWTPLQPPLSSSLLLSEESRAEALGTGEYDTRTQRLTFIVH